MLYLAASHIWMRADTFGDITLLFFLTNTFLSLKQCTVYPDLPSFLSPYFITGESYRPGLLLTDKNILYILKVTVSFETNIQNNSDRRATKYSSLINDLSFSYRRFQFVNLSLSTIGAMGSSCTSLLFLLNDLHINKTIKKKIIMKAMAIFLDLAIISSVVGISFRLT